MKYDARAAWQYMLSPSRRKALLVVRFAPQCATPVVRAFACQSTRVGAQSTIILAMRMELGRISQGGAETLYLLEENEGARPSAKMKTLVGVELVDPLQPIRRMRASIKVIR